MAGQRFHHLPQTGGFAQIGATKSAMAYFLLKGTQFD
jgi:hypothetical protein